MICCITYKRESASSCLSFSLFVNFLSPIKNSVTVFSAHVRARVFKFCIHLERSQVYRGKENQDVVINFCLLFQFFLFSNSHSNVIHRKICVKDFSGITAPRILKLGMTCCIVWKRISLLLIVIPFICPFFFLSKHIFCYKFLSLYESQSLQILYTHWEWPSILLDRKQNCWDLFRLLFPLFHVIHKEICDRYFSGTFAPRILSCGTNVVNHLLYKVKETGLLLLNLPLISSFFRSLQFSKKKKKKSSLFSKGLRGLQSLNLVHTWTVGWCIMYTSMWYMHTWMFLFVCVEVLRPSQQLRSCRAGQLPINTVPGQA